MIVYFFIIFLALWCIWGIKKIEYFPKDQEILIRILIIIFAIIALESFYSDNKKSKKINEYLELYKQEHGEKETELRKIEIELELSNNSKKSRTRPIIIIQRQ